MDPPLNPFIFFPAAITNDFWILQASNPALPLNPLLYTRLIFFGIDTTHSNATFMAYI